MGLKLVTAPATYPVSLAEAKAHVREDSSDFDTQIQAFVYTATQYVDGPKGFLGRALIDQTWDYYLDEFPHGLVRHHWRYRSQPIEIPLPPLIAVSGVFYLDGNGVEQEFDASNYTVDDTNEPGRVVLKSGKCWPTVACEPNSVRIRFRAGYIDANSPPQANVPYPIKAAILMYVGDLYANRESQIVGDTAAKLPWAAEQLLRPHRVTMSMA